MSCLTPITLSRKESQKFRTGYISDVVPCGQCPHCLRRRQNGWIFRLKQEQIVSDTSAFVTLTYDDDHIPFTENGNQSLDKRDTQLFMKRLRKTTKSLIKHPPKIKYYTVGEYGTQTHRPHYHSIMFDVPREILSYPEILQSIWQKGHVRVDEANEATIGYVTKYVMKQLKFQPRHDLDDRQMEFSLMSKKMGMNYLTPQIKKFYQQNMLPYLVAQGGQKISMPRYYKEKIFTKTQQKQLAKLSLEYQEKIDQFGEDFRLEAEWKKDQFRKRDKLARLSRDKL